MKQAVFLLIFMLTIAYSNVPSLRAAEGGNGAEVKAQIWAEAGLKKNQEYLHLLNPAVSNFGSETEKQVFKRAVNLHLQAQIYFLAFQFGKSYEYVRRTQEVMIKLFETVLDNSRLRVYQDLTSFAPQVFQDKYNVKANKYMQLGIRDLEVAALKMQNEHNTRPWLYLMKLNDLADAIKLIRHANRYVMLLRILYQSIYRTPLPEQLSYEEAQLIITSGFPGRQKELLQEHSDNYFKVGVESRDLLIQYTENPEIKILKEQLPGWDEKTRT
jgi:tellurite resistance-related uncharacterized protein